MLVPGEIPSFGEKIEPNFLEVKRMLNRNGKNAKLTRSSLIPRPGQLMEWIFRVELTRAELYLPERMIWQSA